MENNFTKDISDEEVWKMLEPKMKKNGLKWFDYVGEGDKRIYFYVGYDVYKAVALAYRAGYLRAKKGRPFKYKSKDENK